MAVYKCATCGSLWDGAAFHIPERKRFDVFRGWTYGPEFCSEACRSAYLDAGPCLVCGEWDGAHVEGCALDAKAGTREVTITLVLVDGAPTDPSDLADGINTALSGVGFVREWFWTPEGEAVNA